VILNIDDKDIVFGSNYNELSFTSTIDQGYLKTNELEFEHIYDQPSKHEKIEKYHNTKWSDDETILLDYSNNQEDLNHVPAQLKLIDDEWLLQVFD
jgi:hypothetical protein